MKPSPQPGDTGSNPGRRRNGRLHWPIPPSVTELRSRDECGKNHLSKLLEGGGAMLTISISFQFYYSSKPTAGAMLAFFGGLAFASKKIADAKLAKDFQAVLKEFQKAQRLSAERETAYTPFVPQAVLPSSYTASEIDIGSDKTQEQRALLVESRRQEVLLLDNEIIFNEATIEEREQGIQEIQQQIGEVNEIFKDLAVLVHDQGIVIDDIESNIDNAHAGTGQAKVQLAKASKTQKSNSSLTCLLLVIFGVVLLIVIIVLAA
ncbi:hypothetical protein Taro_003134 [Colocasia esculenta]|uniref:t-SNARE coiled-coil homology domain-containing protein n=1 Tax=Colocasia esculenta TaxID=4460 RepID=A0A843TN88_COLES|nr:hypothetical protein [Colocasia esculenta]